MDKHLYETKFTDNIREESAQIFEMTALFSFLGIFFVMLTQALLWFKHGIWPHFYTLKILTPYLPNSFLDWLLNPQSMQEFSKLFNTILDVELSASLLVIGLLAYLMFKILDEKNPDEAIKETDISTLPSRDDWEKDF